MSKLTIFLPLLIALLLPQLLFAQTASPSAAAELDSADTNAADEIRSAVKQKVKQKLNNITNRPVGIVSTVKNITENTLVVVSEPDNFTITTTADTQYFKIPGKKSVDRTEIGIDQTILVLGHLPNDSDTVDSRIIQLIPEPEPLQYQTWYGRLTAITAKAVAITLPDNNTQSVDITKNTKFTQLSGNQITTIKPSDLSENDTVIISSLPDPKKPQNLQAVFVHVSSPSSSSPSATESGTAR